jgi:MFS transporter, PHS family, inorganic phosphate transporter
VNRPAAVDRIARKTLQAGGLAVMAVAFLLLWLVPGATGTLGTFAALFGATYSFSEFGPNTTTFVYPAEIFPVHVRTTSRESRSLLARSARSSPLPSSGRSQ